MSMELYVLSDHRLESIDEWQRAIDVGGFPVRLFTGRPFIELSGVLPVQLGDRQTAFECGHWDPGDLVETYTDIDFGHRWKYTLAFRWTGNPYEGIAAYMAGSAYAGDRWRRFRLSGRKDHLAGARRRNCRRTRTRHSDDRGGAAADD